MNPGPRPLGAADDNGNKEEEGKRGEGRGGEGEEGR